MIGAVLREPPPASRLREGIQRACFGPLPSKPLRLPPRPELPSAHIVIRLPEASSELPRLARSCVNLFSNCLQHCAARGGRCLRRNCEQDAAQIVKPPELWKLCAPRSDALALTPRGVPTSRVADPANTEMNMTTKIVLALALAMTALASVPASASPRHDWRMAANCQEDLGYGRTSGWGCG